MNRRAAWTLVLLWSASAWAQVPDLAHPNLAGNWILVRSRSQIQSPTSGVTMLRLDHEDGAFKLSLTVAEQGRSETSRTEIRTDGKETMSRRWDQTFYDRAAWEGDRLAIVTRIVGDWGEARKVAKYSLSPDGNTLTAEERFTYPSLSFEMTWVYRRADGEPSLGWPKLTLKPLGWGHLDGRYPAGERILLQLAITNDQQVPVELRLRDHGKDGNQEPLWSLAARITDKEGKLLTSSECCYGTDEWWTSALVISDSCAPGECELPGDYVTLDPGKTVLRAAELNTLVWNCPGLAKMHRTTLPAGTYDVQLTVDGLISEPLRIVVIE
ncbi:MAG: hypothetical protein QOH06_1163 [Acidobacteriota bacterium]|nr:hypothetical protein [Acidobacteriota bacterium]